MKIEEEVSQEEYFRLPKLERAGIFISKEGKYSYFKLEERRDPPLKTQK